MQLGLVSRGFVGLVAGHLPSASCLKMKEIRAPKGKVKVTSPKPVPGNKELVR